MKPVHIVGLCGILSLIFFLATPVFFLFNWPNPFLPSIIGVAFVLFVLIPVLIWFRKEEKRKYERSRKELSERFGAGVN